jgi:hypothetical protein
VHCGKFPVRAPLARHEMTFGEISSRLCEQRELRGQALVSVLRAAFDCGFIGSSYGGGNHRDGSGNSSRLPRFAAAPEQDSARR